MGTDRIPTEWDTPCDVKGASREREVAANGRLIDSPCSWASAEAAGDPGMSVTIRFDASNPFVQVTLGNFPGMTLNVIVREATDTVFVGGAPPGSRFYNIGTEARIILGGADLPSVRLARGLSFGEELHSMFHRQLSWTVPSIVLDVGQGSDTDSPTARRNARYD